VILPGDDAELTQGLLSFVGATSSVPAPVTVAHELRKGILQLAPSEGARLFSINDLAKHTGMSLGVIREAISQLQSSGLIEVKQGARGGVFMRRVGEDSLVRTLDALVQSNKVPRESVAEARRELEGLCARLAAERATAEDITRLYESIDHMSSLLTKPAEFAEENVQFHLLICQATGNPVLIAVASALREVFFSSSLQRRYTPAVLDEALHAHMKIVKEIEGRQADHAASAMVGHINALEQQLRLPRRRSARPASARAGRGTGST
jgi:GntR family transcriptional repressor for pyruvate dehydrogenase complex